MMKFAIFATCLAVVCCQSQLDVPTDAGCCTPREWEGAEGVVGGYAGFLFKKGFVRGFASVHYDANAKKVASFSNMTVGRRNYVAKVIEDYTQKKLYIIDAEKRKCKVTPLKMEFKEACIPDDAQKLGNFYYGGGAAKLNSVAFIIKKQSKRFHIEATVAMTARGCLPIGETLVGKVKNVNFLDNIGFVDITIGIRDPSVFTPPSFCNNATTSAWEMAGPLPYREYRIFGI